MAEYRATPRGAEEGVAGTGRVSTCSSGADSGVAGSAAAGDLAAGGTADKTVADSAGSGTQQQAWAELLLASDTAMREEAEGWVEDVLVGTESSYDLFEEPATTEELAEQKGRQQHSNGSTLEWYQPEQQELEPPLQKDSPEVKRRIAVVKECLQRLKGLASGEVPENCNRITEEGKDAWVRQLQEEIKELADAEQFKSGGPNRLYWVWHAMFKEAGQLLGEETLKRRQVRWLLQLLRRGIEPELVPATAECQFENRRHEDRLVRCSRELAQLVDRQQLKDYLDGPELLPVQFPNSSKLQGPKKLAGVDEFLAETRDTLLAQDVLEPTGGRRPMLVHRLTVDTKKEKKRLCVDAVYMNLRSKNKKFM